MREAPGPPAPPFAFVSCRWRGAYGLPATTSQDGSQRAIGAAFLANLGIALAKSVSFLVTGATSMLAEADRRPHRPGRGRRSLGRP
jgi:hypothetical protein